MPNSVSSGSNFRRSQASDLALNGGNPIRQRDWPKWPRADQNVQRNVYDVLHSTRWTQSGESHRGWSYATKFSEAFASYLGVKHAIPCSSGSAGLSSAMEALEIGPGDEVIIPGQTWVACASSVLNTGAMPIFADLDTDSLCISPDAVAELITPRTKAVMAVHWHCARADMPSLAKLCATYGLSLIEDASQAHGASLGGDRVGSLGTVGVFSFQQSKLLTAGEGGICVTDDDGLAERILRLRSDGRTAKKETHQEILTAKALNSSQEESLLTVPGESYGTNRCMAEFQAAILLGGLKRLDAENQHRRNLAKELDDMLVKSGLGAPAQSDVFEESGRTFYRYTIRINREALGQLKPEVIARALQYELRLAVKTMDQPLPDNPLFQPFTMPFHHAASALSAVNAQGADSLPVAYDAWNETIALPHQTFLGDRTDLDDVIAGLGKIADIARNDPDALRVKAG